MTPPQDQFDVAIIGAGAAGLRAALTLTDAGKRVLILEARDRPGGRIHTIHPNNLDVPVELGAEFIHGTPPETFALLQRLRLAYYDVTATHRAMSQGKLTAHPDIWTSVATVLQKAARLRGDLSVDAFLERHTPGTALQRKQTQAFIQGFDAADTSEISIQQLVHDQQHSDENADRSFRIIGGYGRMIEQLLIVAANAQIIYSTPVHEITWRKNAVTIAATQWGDARTFHAKQIIVTSPIGVLAGDQLIFSPPLPPPTRRAIDHLRMGPVVRLTLGFRTRFWESLANGKLMDLGFAHRWGTPFPTFWTQLPLRSPTITAWAGGNRALALAPLSTNERIAAACRGWSAALRAGGAKAASDAVVQKQLSDAWTHDWQQDRWARGAYSYVAVDGIGSREQLAKPIDRTLWIAGEATVATGESGTVEAALVSGRRAAEAILASA